MGESVGGDKPYKVNSRQNYRWNVVLIRSIDVM
jgi:hypothetical protein